MSWRSSWLSKVVKMMSPWTIRTPRKFRNDIHPSPHLTNASAKHPHRLRGKQKCVPTDLVAAMATVKSGDFIFDPVSGR
jgi:hypothetical protein